jgi:1-acyl-sn-glycerol-3-phosphate acyltransferase
MSATSSTATDRKQFRLFNTLRTLLRCLLVTLHILGGILMQLLLVLPLGLRWYDTHSGRWIIRKWMQILSWILGLDIEQRGQPSQGLLVANHVSWLDVMAINSLTEARFLSKADVKRWPLIGQLLALSGTLFLDRGSLSSLRKLNETLRDLIRRERTIVIFPEGTTTDGSEVLHFHGGVIQSALDNHAPVQPVALRYDNNGKLDKIAPFIGDDAFFFHLIRVVSRPRTRVVVHFLPVIDTTNTHRRQAAEEARAVIAAELQRLAKQQA